MQLIVIVPLAAILGAFALLLPQFTHEKLVGPVIPSAIAAATASLVWAILYLFGVDSGEWTMWLFPLLLAVAAAFVTPIWLTKHRKSRDAARFEQLTHGVIH